MFCSVQVGEMLESYFNFQLHHRTIFNISLPKVEKLRKRSFEILCSGARDLKYGGILVLRTDNYYFFFFLK